MIFAIIGPTASNKSFLVDEFVSYLNNDVLVINFDAYQIYKQMNIGTAKPSKEFLKLHKNYLMYDFVDVNQKFDVCSYQKIVRKIIDDNINKNIILVGGTGFYLKSLLYDYKYIEEPPMSEDYLRDLTNEELYNKLFLVDPIDANKITMHNRKRLLRALYVYEVHKKSKTELNNNGKNKLLYPDVVFIGISPNRNLLYENINNRVDKMIKDGLVNEVNLLKKEYPFKNQALEAIGYKEFFYGLSLNDTIELIKKNTRHYAKRQLTYFKHQFENVLWFEDAESALKFLKQKY